MYCYFDSFELDAYKVIDHDNSTKFLVVEYNNVV